jgi:hypothetical protein
MLTYSHNEEIIKIQETPNGSDIEFHIEILKEDPYVHFLKQVQRYFEDNRIHTDVLFYVKTQHHYSVIVRSDYYEDFVLQLMRHRLLQSVEWS